MTPADKRKRVAFAKKAAQYDLEFWRSGIAFYFDGVGFAHKTNPYSKARAANSMAWRRRNEGLSRTTRGRKEGSGGNMAHFFVAIAHTHGVVLCKQYPWVLTGERFAKFVKQCFPPAFHKCGTEARGSRFLQDGDPRQISKVAQAAWEKLGCEMFSIPARSPDINPIENFFHLVRNKLRTDAYELEIKKESYAEFAKRVARTMKEFPTDVIDRTIDSMNRRLRMIISKRGDRTKY